MNHIATDLTLLEIQKIKEKIFKIFSNEQNFFTKDLINLIFQDSKFIRSTIAILFKKALNLDFSEKDITICAITEIIHNASLLHDDIIDNSDIRRGKKSFNNAFGTKLALLTGDYLISLAIKELFTLKENEITQNYLNMFLQLCKGEIEEIQNKNKIISLEKYITKNELKTAELFKITLSSIFQDNKKYQNLVENFGKNFGIAFQIRDDIKDFVSKDNNKPHQIDFKNEICTAPIIFAHTNEKFVNEISIEKINKTDAFSKSNLLCKKYTNNSLDLLKDFVDNQYTKALKLVCENLKGNY